MKRIISVILCYLFIFSLLSQSVYASPHRIWFATSLTGGGTGSLDGAVSGVSISANDAAIVATSGGTFYQFKADTNTLAENAPWIIRPDDVGGGVTSWILAASSTTGMKTGWIEDPRFKVAQGSNLFLNDLAYLDQTSSDGTLLITHPIDIPATVMSPANVTLMFRGAGNINSGTIIIAGPIDAVSGQTIFRNAAGVTISGQRNVWASWFEGGVTQATHSGASVIDVDRMYSIDEGSAVTMFEGQWLRGHGWQTGVQAADSIDDSGDDAHLIVNATTLSGTSGLRVSDMSIEGRRQQVRCIEFLASNPVSGQSNYDTLIENVNCDGAEVRGIFIGQAERPRVLNTRVTRWGSILADAGGNPPAEDGIRFTYANNYIIDNSYISNKDLITTLHANNKTAGRHGVCIGTDTQGPGTITNTFVDTTERNCYNIEGHAKEAILSNSGASNCGTDCVKATSDRLIIDANRLITCGENCVEVGGKDITGIDGHNTVSNNYCLNPGFGPQEGNNGNGDRCGITTSRADDFNMIVNNTVVGASSFGFYLERGAGVCQGNIAYGNQNDNFKFADPDWVVMGNIGMNSVAGDGFSWGGDSNLIFIGNMAKNNVGEGFDGNSGSTGVFMGNSGVSNTGGNFSGFLSAWFQTWGNIDSAADSDDYYLLPNRAFGGPTIGGEIVRWRATDVDEPWWDFSGGVSRPSSMPTISNENLLAWPGAASGNSVWIRVEFNNNATDQYYILAVPKKIIEDGTWVPY